MAKITGGIESRSMGWIHSESDGSEPKNMMYCDDFRLRLPPDDPDRIKYEEEQQAKTPEQRLRERTKEFRIMHEAGLIAARTIFDRGAK